MRVQKKEIWLVENGQEGTPDVNYERQHMTAHKQLMPAGNMPTAAENAHRLGEVALWFLLQMQANVGEAN